MWGRLIASLFSFLIVPAFAAAQDNSDLKLGVGSKLFWGPTDSSYSETVMAIKDDFVLYLNDEFESDIAEPSDYYAIFSGIYFQTCDGEMPSKIQRDALAKFLPLKEGAQLFSDVVGGLTLDVTNKTKPFLMGKYRDGYELKVSYTDEDYGGETIQVIDGLPLNVRVAYDDETVYRLNLLTSSDKIGVQDGLDLQNIGNCASLITK